MMYLLYYGVIDFYIGFLAGVKAFTAAVLGGIGSLPGRDAGRAADRADRDLLVGLFLGRIQGRRGLLDPRHRADLPADGAARASPKSRRSEPWQLPNRRRGRRPLPSTAKAPRAPIAVAAR
jgi:hypothetical protein